MTNTDLQKIQKNIKFDGPSMAVCLGIDKEQYRRYFYGHTAIPANIERAALELEKFEKHLDRERVARIDETISKQFPNGIVSDVEVWE